MRTSTTGPECPHCGYTEYAGDVKIEDGYTTVYDCNSCGREFHSECSVTIEWSTETLREKVVEG